MWAVSAEDVGKERCPLCGRLFAAGDLVTFVVEEPSDEEERAKAESGKPYTTTALIGHVQCDGPAGAG